MAVPTWVTEAGVIGTWVIGVLALFGERIRAWLLKPKLHLSLKSNVGDLNTQGTVETRYYHLVVTNQAKYPKAQDVQVLLLGVERTDQVQPGKPGDLYVPLPLGWAYGLYPLVRSIGSTTEGIADLLLVREGVLQFVPVLVPNNFQSAYSGETHLRVTAVARGTNCESNIVRLKIDWDGKWERDDNAMLTHFVISAA